MNPTIKAKWLKALRSGDYKQTTGALYADGGYCCLGVLCDVLGAIPAAAKKDDFWGNFAILPANVAKRAGISENPVPSGYTDSLADLNDSGSSFEDIADIIEQQL